MRVVPGSPPQSCRVFTRLSCREIPPDAHIFQPGTDRTVLIAWIRGSATGLKIPVAGSGTKNAGYTGIIGERSRNRACQEHDDAEKKFRYPGSYRPLS